MATATKTPTPNGSAPNAVLRTGTSVRLRTDLPGVAAGTAGTVTMVQGLSWIRYWVRFDTGMAVGTIGRNKLATDDEWERLQNGTTEPDAAGPLDTPAEAAAGPAAAASVGGVPAHLLERAQKARERAAAKKAAEG